MSRMTHAQREYQRRQRTDGVITWQRKAHAAGRCISCNQPHARLNPKGALARKCATCQAADATRAKARRVRMKAARLVPSAIQALLRCEPHRRAYVLSLFDHEGMPTSRESSIGGHE